MAVEGEQGGEIPQQAVEVQREEGSEEHYPRVTQQTQIAEGRLETVIYPEHMKLEISHHKKSWKSCTAAEKRERERERGAKCREVECMMSNDDNKNNKKG